MQKHANVHTSKESNPNSDCISVKNFYKDTVIKGEISQIAVPF